MPQQFNSKDHREILERGDGTDWVSAGSKTAVAFLHPPSEGEAGQKGLHAKSSICVCSLSLSLTLALSVSLTLFIHIYIYIYIQGA